MGRRKYERVQSNIKVRFFNGSAVCAGTVMNLSENGMFVRTEICFPFNLEFEIIFHVKKKLLKVPVKINRLTKVVRCYGSLAVEVLHPSMEYLEFVQAMKSAYKSRYFFRSGVFEQGQHGKAGNKEAVVLYKKNIVPVFNNKPWYTLVTKSGIN